jgi:hypothetical protein
MFAAVRARLFGWRLPWGWCVCFAPQILFSGPNARLTKPTELRSELFAAGVVALPRTHLRRFSIPLVQELSKNYDSSS